MAYDANIDYRARQNQYKDLMKQTTDPAELERLQGLWDADEASRTEKLASNLSKLGKWASDSELDSAAGLIAQNQIGTGFDIQRQNLNKSYDLAKQNASNDALSRGMARSSYIGDRMASLDSNRADALSNIDATQAHALQAAKQDIIDRYRANEERKLALEKAEFAQNIGAYNDNYMLEIERIRDNGDPSDDWKIPYLQAARQQKIAGNAELNMQYGDFSGAGSLGLSPLAQQNAQKMFDYNNRKALMQLYGGGGSGGGSLRSGGSYTPSADGELFASLKTPVKSEADSPTVLASLNAQLAKIEDRGVSVTNNAKNLIRNYATQGLITEQTANRFLKNYGL